MILITGGTGTFGSALLRRLIGTEEIRILSRDEKKQDDLRREINNPNVKFYIGDVRDIDSVNHAMRGVDYVFHAAALKQVPSCEFFPIEAVKTNILGVENVLNSAIANQVKKVIVLSTDKACYPVSAMGMSKALMEKLMIARSGDSETILCATRHGNIIGSRSSVIPLFREQIISGKPITVTDPKMTRFMMTVDNAIDLVLHAFKEGKSGDIFVHKSPSIVVGDLVTAMKEFYNADNKVSYIGARCGEKLHEILVTSEEISRVVESENHYKIRANLDGVGYCKPEGGLFPEYSSGNADKLSIEQIKLLL